ncbi:MAG: ATP-dependent endonuclease [Acidimicrobiales bacterium]
MEWALDPGLVCLLGPGDATKTTILDAISLVLSPSWRIQATDADFYKCDTDSDIVVEATVANPPTRLIAEDALGLMKRGVAPDGTIINEPTDEAAPALTVRLRVSADLEPQWTVCKDGVDERRITAPQRAMLGLFRLDEQHDTHLTWSRTSALAALTGQTEELSGLLTTAQREARRAVFDRPNESLQKAADTVAKQAAAMGASAFAGLQPGLDPRATAGGASLVLHEGDVPITRHGLGTRRLTSLAVQSTAIDESAIIIIDEVEHALEPHRLYHVLRQLQTRCESGRGQVILTTHSPLTLESLDAEQLHIVRSHSGTTNVMRVPEQIADMKMGEPQKTVRSGPSAMLARRVVVTEGPTELGLCLGLLDRWDQERGVPVAVVGTAFRNGQGSEAPTKARCLAELGYPTLVFLDSDDRGVDEEVHRAENAGALVARWAEGIATESQVAQDLSIEGLADLLQLAVDMNETDDPLASVIGAVGARIDGQNIEELDPAAWITSGADEASVRTAIGEAAKGKEWFKSQSRGIRLGRLVSEHWDDLGGTDLRAKLGAVRDFAYEVAEA